MVVGLALDIHGWPLWCELWPGNTADFTTLLPVVNQLRQRFRLRRVFLWPTEGRSARVRLQLWKKTDRDHILGAPVRSVEELC